MLAEPERHDDLLAIQRGEFCTTHKTLLEDNGSCEECILSKPAWKEPVPPKVEKQAFNWTTAILWAVIAICVWGGICWYVADK